MEAAGLALAAAQTLLTALGCPHLQHIFYNNGYQSELESLAKTVASVEAVLLDAQSRDHHNLTNLERVSIQRLKDALYDADDLLDQFATLARLRRISDDDKLLGKVRHLFRRFKKVKTLYKMSNQVKTVRKLLDRTTKEAALFGFKVKLDPQHYRVFSRDETHSYADENSIVGRDEDKSKIVDMLLDPNVLEDVFVLTIVGVGGLGKTSLAQLVYNDKRIQTEFHSRIWVCVSDQDQNKPDKAKLILANILKSTTVGARSNLHTDNRTYDSIVQELRKELGKGKFMLVLDDVWTEDAFQSREWLDVLMGLAHRGSRIIVTTRSKKTATAVGSKYVHELQGLSNESAWRLFEMVVGDEQANRPDLMDMGRDIVKKCANVPLAIKVLGSLLRDQDKSKWQHFHQRKLNEIRVGDSGNHIMEILKFSYYHLRPELKTCFTYCAIFPKDFKIQKNKLIWLWMAHGYVKLHNEGDILEEVAEEYFQILVQRCFFQDFVRDKYDGKIRFKIHDLMHDMAQQAAGNEVIIGGSDPSSFDKRVRHFFDDQPRSHHGNNFGTRTTIRTYVCGPSSDQFPMRTLLANWRCLRALDISYLGIKVLPSEIGELLHLRYVNLSWNRDLKVLPESFTKLINLQILILEACSSLKELPKDFGKLVNLRTLHVWESGGFYTPALSYMPLGMEKLSSLTQLDWFVVANRAASLKHDVGGLRDLNSLMNLRGSLKIWIARHYEHVKEDGGEGYLCNKKHLKDICIEFGNKHGEETFERDRRSDEALLEDLFPHPNLEVLTIKGYKGVEIPSWGKQHNLTIFLPNLVKISFERVNGLQSLPYLSKLSSLKQLRVSYMENLMYMENRRIAKGIQEVSSSWFFPSLEELDLSNLPKLEGWWNTPSVLMHGCELRMGIEEMLHSNNNAIQSISDHPVPSFPCLSRLYIDKCPRLTCIPLCPTVEKVQLREFNERLQIMIKEGNSSGGPKLRYLKTDKLRHLSSLPARALQNVEEIEVETPQVYQKLGRHYGAARNQCDLLLLKVARTVGVYRGGWSI